MSHPHQSMLDEFKYAFDHFVPTLPDLIKEEAKNIHSKLLSDQSSDEVAIKNAFYDLGIQEYPHRKAYEELTLKKGAARLVDLVLEHVDDSVKKIVKPHLDSGVSLTELVSSDLFDTKLTPEEKYQVEDGVLVGKSKLADELKGDISDQSDEYKNLVEKWTKTAEQIDSSIEKLKKLGQSATADQKQEIENKVSRFREGFLLTERDPELFEVEKEIEYWADTLSQE